MRGSRERRWNKLNSIWKIKCWPRDFHFWTTLLNVSQGIFLRVLDVFHYFHVWGTQICRENILFRTKRPSFWCFKISVHLGLKEQIFTRSCFDWFGGCRSPNQERFIFLESPRRLFLCPKISDLDSLWFGNYRSWSATCSRRIKSEATKLLNFVRRIPDVF